MKTVSGEQQFKLTDTLFQACWVDRVDLGSDAEIRTYLDSHGLDGSLFLSSVSRPEIKKQLITATKKAVELGVFGVPSFVVDKELFWGVDQISYLEDYLEGNDPIARISADELLTEASWGLD